MDFWVYACETEMYTQKSNFSPFFGVCRLPACGEGGGGGGGQQSGLIENEISVPFFCLAWKSGIR